jgi:hypothetical protein
MAKLSSKARKKLPKKDFAGPKRSFPIENKGHARAALRLVGRAVKAGSISAAQAAKVRSRAKKKLGK